MHARPLLLPTREAPTLAAVIEPLAEDDERWWNKERVRKFYTSMAPLHRARIREMYRGRPHDSGHGLSSDSARHTARRSTSRLERPVAFERCEAAAVAKFSLRLATTD